MNRPASAPQATDQVTGTATRTANVIADHHTSTNTIVSPGLAVGPNLTRIRGFRLDQILLFSTVGLVLVIISLLAALYAYSTAQQFSRIADNYNERIQAQARELGTTVSHTLSLTSASALRDSNYAFLGEVVREIIAKNPNVLRVQIIDPEMLSVADSHPEAELGAVVQRSTERGSRIGSYGAQPVIEYQEPIDYGAQSGSGLVVLSYSLAPLQTELRSLETWKKAALQQAIARTAAIGFGFVVLAGVLAAVFSRRVSRPLDSLARGAMDLASGNLDARVPNNLGGGREVGTLGVVFNHMAERLSHLVEDARVKAVLEREMSLARQVQEALLPSREAFFASNLKIAGAVVTADACGGDWWLRASIDDKKVVLGLGDVTGHGLAPALVATSATAGFAAAIRMKRPEEVNARELIMSLNQTLHLVGKGEHQMSCVLAVFNTATQEIDFASGAHPSALVYHRDTGEVGSLMTRGSLLGAAPNTEYQSRTVKLRAGDVIIWYTDGLTESENTSRVQYGTQRLLQCVKANSQLPADRLRDAILLDVRQHMQTQPQSDDITVVVAEYVP